MGETSVGDNGDVLKRSSALEEGFLSERKELGTDVIIIGQPKNIQPQWIDLMTQSVIRNFFASILEKKLVVKIENIKGESRTIDPDTLFDFLGLFDPYQRRRDFKEIPPDSDILQCIDAFQYGEVFNSLKLKKRHQFWESVR